MQKYLSALLKVPLWWITNIGSALSQLLGAFLLGDPDETISSRLGKMRAAGKKWVIPFCNILDWIDEGHCANSARLDGDEGKKSVFNRFKREIDRYE